jgi:hypothetical protein
MTNQHNNLRALYVILNNAVKEGKPEENAGYVLLDTMKLERKYHNFIFFYELFGRAKDDAVSLITIKDGIYEEEYNEQINAINDLQDFFISNNPFSQNWATFLGEIKRGRYLAILSPLARDYHERNPKVFLDQDFLNKLSANFTDLSKEIFESELSSEFKKYLIDKVEDVIRSIRRYAIDGTDGLEKTVKSLVCDLTLGEYSLANKDKESSIYNKFRAITLSLFFAFVPTPWDLIGFIPDYQQFWKPTFEQLIEGQKEIEEIGKACTSISEIIKESEAQKICISKRN